MVKLSYPGTNFPLSWASLGFSQPPRLGAIPASNVRALANYAWWSYEREKRLAAKQVSKVLKSRRALLAGGYADAFQKAAALAATWTKADGTAVRIQLGQLDKAALRPTPVSVKRQKRPKLWTTQEALEPEETPDLPSGGPRPAGGSDGAVMGVGLGLLLYLLYRRRSRRSR